MRPLRNGAVFWGIAAATIATRWPFRSRMLYHWDSGNFALAIHHYDVAIHQPHPPGYFIYVMLARVAYLFTQDDNSALVILSLIATIFTTYLLWRIGTRLFGPQIGALSALIFFFGPMVWFLGEVGLSYLIGAACVLWIAHEGLQILDNPQRPAWRIGLLLALAGGVRQNVAVFMLPLAVYTIRHRRPKEIALCLAIFAVACVAWFVPMVWASGGWDAYHDAVADQWKSQWGRVSIFQIGFHRPMTSVELLILFSTQALGVFLPFMFIACYAQFRRHGMEVLRKDSVRFLLMWLTPAGLFYMLIFLIPANNGFIMDLLPALAMLCALGLMEFVAAVQRSLAVTIQSKWTLGTIFASVLLLINVGIFLFSHAFYASLYEVREHDRVLSEITSEIRHLFDPRNTLITTSASVRYSYRNIMYYLPQFYVVYIDSTPGPRGEHRRLFWGKDRMSWVTPDFQKPPGITRFIVVRDPIDNERARELDQIGLLKPPLGEHANYRYGPIEFLERAYPHLKHKAPVTEGKGRL